VFYEVTVYEAYLLKLTGVAMVKAKDTALKYAVVESDKPHMCVEEDGILNLRMPELSIGKVYSVEVVYFRDIELFLEELETLQI
jgi:hypothetical protein